jgi:1-acyl-sn-glycerol-3-phosphate acyltransferase
LKKLDSPQCRKVERSQSDNLVEQSIQQFQRNDQLILTLAPAGTRRRVIKWKSGIYHIACGAGATIVLGFLDYRRKVGGIRPVNYPNGNIAADMKTIRAFYDGVTGKNPAQSMSSGDFIR